MSLTAHLRLPLIRQDLEILVAMQIITDTEKDVHNWTEMHPLFSREPHFILLHLLHICKGFNFE